MGRRPEVETASVPETAGAMARLAFGLGKHLTSATLSRPWQGPNNAAVNTAHEMMRISLKELMTFASDAPTPELRSIEILMDDICELVLPAPTVRANVHIDTKTWGGVTGVHITPKVDDRTSGIVLYLHGGGYVATTPKMYRGLATRIALDTGCDIFIPDFRLAPEFPYPASLEDAASVYKALLDEHEPETIAIAGDSGGGGLTAALLEDINTADMPQPACAVLFSPEVDLTLSGTTIRENVDSDILPAEIPVAGYLAGMDAQDPEVSPLFADPHGFPPMCIVAGDNEMFRDEIERFVANAQRADVEVEYYDAPDMFHVFEIVLPRAKQTQIALDDIREFVLKHLNPK